MSIIQNFKNSKPFTRKIQKTTKFWPKKFPMINDYSRNFVLVQVWSFFVFWAFERFWILEILNKTDSCCVFIWISSMTLTFMSRLSHLKCVEPWGKFRMHVRFNTLEWKDVAARISSFADIGEWLKTWS